MATGSNNSSTSVAMGHEVRMALFSLHHVDGLGLTVNPLLYMMKCYLVKVGRRVGLHLRK